MASLKSTSERPPTDGRRHRSLSQGSESRTLSPMPSVEAESKSDAGKRQSRSRHLKTPKKKSKSLSPGRVKEKKKKRAKRRNSLEKSQEEKIETSHNDEGQSQPDQRRPPAKKPSNCSESSAAPKMASSNTQSLPCERDPKFYMEAKQKLASPATSRKLSPVSKADNTVATTPDQILLFPSKNQRQKPSLKFDRDEPQSDQIPKRGISEGNKDQGPILCSPHRFPHSGPQSRDSASLSNTPAQGQKVKISGELRQRRHSQDPALLDSRSVNFTTPTAKRRSLVAPLSSDGYSFTPTSTRRRKTSSDINPLLHYQDRSTDLRSLGCNPTPRSRKSMKGSGDLGTPQQSSGGVSPSLDSQSISTNMARLFDLRREISKDEACQKAQADENKEEEPVRRPLPGEVFSAQELFNILQESNEHDQPKERMMNSDKLPNKAVLLSLDELADILCHVNNSGNTEIRWDMITRMVFRDEKDDLDPLRPFNAVEFANQDNDTVSSISLEANDYGSDFRGSDGDSFGCPT